MAKPDLKTLKPDSPRMLGDSINCGLDSMDSHGGLNASFGLSVQTLITNAGKAKPYMLQASELEKCPFCNSQPYFGLGKKGNCQLHGEPFQSVVIFCKKHECPAKPKVEGGDIYNGGEAKARIEVAKLWNRRGVSI